MALFGPWLITLWYGQAFAPAGAPLPWAAVGVAMMSIFVIITRDFTGAVKQRVNTIAGVVALVANVALNFYLIPRYGIVGAAFATAVSYTGACVILIGFFVRRVAPRRATRAGTDDARTSRYFIDLLRGAIGRLVETPRRRVADHCWSAGNDGGRRFVAAIARRHAFTAGADEAAPSSSCPKPMARCGPPTAHRDTSARHCPRSGRRRRAASPAR